MKTSKKIGAIACALGLNLMLSPAIALATGASLMIAFIALNAFAFLLPLIPSNAFAMAIVQNPLIGRSQNKLGGTVFSTWKGKNVLKGKPLTVANPRTDGQVAQRSAMTQAVAIGRAILSSIRRSFIEVSAQSTEWASFIKYNLDEAFTISGNTATLDSGSMTFAKGTLINPADMAYNSTTGFSWTDNSGVSGANASDAFAYATINNNGDVTSVITTDTRASETSPSIGLIPAGTHVYTWFVSNPKGKSSDSQLIV